MVIVILGLLAAVALPRFFDFSEEAELAAAKGVAGAYQTAVLQVQVAFYINRHTTRTQNLVGFGNGDVDTNNIGFPIGTDKGNANENVGRGNAGCPMLWEGLMSAAPSVSLGGGTDYQAYRHTGSKVCSYVYRAGGDTRNRNNAAIVIKYDSRNGSLMVCGSRADIPAC